MDTATLIAISLVVLVIVVIVLALLWSASNTARSKLEEDNSELKRQLNVAKNSLTETHTKLDSAKGELLTIKGSHKKAKEKLHRLSQDQKPVGKGGFAQTADQDALAENRYELANALSEIESLGNTVRQLKAQLAETQGATSKTPAQKNDAPPVNRAAVEAEIRQDFQDKLKATRAELSRKKQEFADEERELKKRLSKTLRESDKQRRRADNNEKAYEITKTQLEKALDRLHKFDPSVPRPFKAPPKPVTKGGKKLEPTQQEKPTTEASSEDSQPAEVTKKAAPKKAANKPASDTKTVSEDSLEQPEDSKTDDESLEPSEEAKADTEPVEPPEADEPEKPKKKTTKAASAKKKPAKKKTKTEAPEGASEEVDE